MDDAPLQRDIDATVHSLSTPEALASIAADPYWPKWDGPWWRMTLLFEMGLADRIPRPCVDLMTRTMNSHYLRFFPFRPEELPPGTDAFRHVACHCCLGTIYQVLSACGVDVDAEIPWIRPWFLKYQLPDGGLNCDESAYTKPEPHSSVVSTLSPLEAVLFCTKRDFTPKETQFLDRGADYLLRRKLFRSLSKGGDIMNPNWQKLCFPRFYEYDLLRGLRFVTAWAERRNQPLPHDAIAEALSLVSAGTLRPERVVSRLERRTRKQDAEGNWSSCAQPTDTFPLLDRVSEIGSPFLYLQREYQKVRERVALPSFAPPHSTR